MFKKNIFLLLVIFVTTKAYAPLYDVSNKKRTETPAKSNNDSILELENMSRELSDFSKRKSMKTPVPSTNISLRELDDMSRALTDFSESKSMRTPPKFLSNLGRAPKSEKSQDLPKNTRLEEAYEGLKEINDLITETTALNDRQSLQELSALRKIALETINHLEGRHHASQNLTSYSSADSNHSMKEIAEDPETEEMGKEKSEEKDQKGYKKVPSSFTNNVSIPRLTSQKKPTLKTSSNLWTEELATTMATTAKNDHLNHFQKEIYDCAKPKESKKNANCPAFLNFVKLLSDNIKKTKKSKTKEKIREILKYLNITTTNQHAFNSEIRWLWDSVALSTDYIPSEKDRELLKTTTSPLKRPAKG